MNRDILNREFHNQLVDFHFGEQPRKSVARKHKKTHFFKKLETEFDELDKGRHSYHRASNKSLTRSQVRTGQILF